MNRTKKDTHFYVKYAENCKKNPQNNTLNGELVTYTYSSSQNNEDSIG